MKQNIDRLIKALWIKACRYDAIPIGTRFAVFTEDNPHMIRYNKVMILKDAEFYNKGYGA